MKITLLRFGAPELQQLVFHQLPRLDVERRERLVHEQDLRIEDQHLRERGALAHAARELVRVAVAEAREAHAREPVLAARVAPHRGLVAAKLAARRSRSSSALRHGISASDWNM